MGRVHRAQDTRLGREVAIKVLRSDLSDDPAHRQRFEHEATVTARINHPNVVAVYDAGEEGDELFLVMECLPGQTLADDIARGPLEADRVQSIALELLGGLSAAHEAGVLHRDIKPANVLFTADGKAKLGDFGIAKLGESMGLTDTGMLIGTAQYLPPERLRGEPATVAGDLYALGVVLYEALAGHPPFRGDTPVILAHAMATTVPPPIDRIRPDVSPALTGTIARAMRKDPHERFTSAASMAAAIDSDQATVGIAVPVTAGPFATTAPATTPTEVTPMTLAATEVQPGLAGAVPSSTAGPEPSGHRTRPFLLIAGTAGIAALVLAVVLVLALAARNANAPADAPHQPTATAPATTTTSAPSTTTTPLTTTAPASTVTTKQPGKGKGKDKVKGNKG